MSMSSAHFLAPLADRSRFLGGGLLWGLAFVMVSGGFSAMAKDTPTKDTPAKDTPAKDTPAKDTPAKDTPAKDTPREALLRYHFVPGQAMRIRLRSASQGTVTLSLPGVEPHSVPTREEMRVVYTLVPGEPVKGRFPIRTTMTVEHLTTQPPVPTQEFIAAIEKTVVRFTVDDRGRTADFKAEYPAMAPGHLTMAGELADSVRTLFDELPEQPVKIGDTWVRERKDPTLMTGLQGELVSRVSYKVRAIEADAVVLDVESSTTANRRPADGDTTLAPSAHRGQAKSVQRFGFGGNRTWTGEGKGTSERSTSIAGPEGQQVDVKAESRGEAAYERIAE